MIVNSVIDKRNEAFDVFKKNISISKVIGLSMVGKNIGREGMISWILIDANKEIFILDVVSLGLHIFMELKEIFENHLIIKIIHDCRFISELLWYQFHINLTNVFDTQIADVLIFRSTNKNLLPEKFKSLYECITQYIAPEPEHLHGFRTRLANYSENEDLLFERPAQETAIKTLISLIQYLKPLRKVQFHRLLKEFYDCVNIHRAYFRDAPSHDILRLKCYPERIPIQFHQISKFSEIALKKEAEKLDSIYSDLNKTDKPILQSNAQKSTTLSIENTHSQMSINQMNKNEYNLIPKYLNHIEDASEGASEDASENASSISNVKCLPKVFIIAGSENRSRMSIKKLKKFSNCNCEFNHISNCPSKKSDNKLTDCASLKMDESVMPEMMHGEVDASDLRTKLGSDNWLNRLYGYNVVETNKVMMADDLSEEKKLPKHLNEDNHSDCVNETFDEAQRSIVSCCDDKLVYNCFNNDSANLYNINENKFRDINFNGSDNLVSTPAVMATLR